MWQRLVLGLAVVMVVYRFASLSQKSFTGDELFTVIEGEQTYKHVLIDNYSPALMQTSNPPGDVFTFKTMQLFLPPTEWGYRFISALAGSLALLLAFLLLSEQLDFASACLGLAWMALSSYFLTSSYEARSYAVQLLLYACIYWQLWRYMQQPSAWRHRALWLGFTLLSTFYHHYSWLLIISTFSYVMLRHKSFGYVDAKAWFKDWFVNGLIVFLGALPNIVVLCLQYKTIHLDAATLDPESGFHIFKNIVGQWVNYWGGYGVASLSPNIIHELGQHWGAVAFVGLSFGAALLLMILAWRQSVVPALWVRFYMWVLLCSVILARFVMHSTVDARHCIVLSIPFVWLMLAGLQGLRRQPILRAAVIVLWLLINGYSTVLFMTSEVHPTFRENLRGLGCVLSNAAKAGDLILVEGEDNPVGLKGVTYYYHGPAPVIGVQLIWDRFYVKYPKDYFLKFNTIYVVTNHKSTEHPIKRARIDRFATELGYSESVPQPIFREQDDLRLITMKRISNKPPNPGPSPQ